MAFFEKGSKDVALSIFLINQLSNFSKPPQSDGAFLTKTDLSTINFVSREALDVLLQEEGDGDQVDVSNYCSCYVSNSDNVFFKGLC